ncbi:MAG: hypothetical protein IJ654_07400 [Bacteroidales bacterium]|nr:hypothetical protein [Bacteroidales bacterium]
MKKIVYVMAALAATAALQGCQKEAAESPVADGVIRHVRMSVGEPATRTVYEYDEAGKAYTVKWAEDDSILVVGLKVTPRFQTWFYAAEVSEDGKSGEFYGDIPASASALADNSIVGVLYPPAAMEVTAAAPSTMYADISQQDGTLEGLKKVDVMTARGYFDAKEIAITDIAFHRKAALVHLKDVNLGADATGKVLSLTLTCSKNNALRNRLLYNANSLKDETDYMVSSGYYGNQFVTATFPEPVALAGGVLPDAYLAFFPNQASTGTSYTAQFCLDNGKIYTMTWTSKQYYEEGKMYRVTGNATASETVYVSTSATSSPYSALLYANGTLFESISTNPAGTSATAGTESSFTPGFHYYGPKYFLAEDGGTMYHMVTNSSNGYSYARVWKGSELIIDQTADGFGGRVTDFTVKGGKIYAALMDSKSTTGPSYLYDNGEVKTLETTAGGAFGVDVDDDGNTYVVGGYTASPYKYAALYKNGQRIRLSQVEEGTPAFEGGLQMVRKGSDIYVAGYSQTVMTRKDGVTVNKIIYMAQPVVWKLDAEGHVTQIDLPVTVTGTETQYIHGAALCITADKDYVYVGGYQGVATVASRGASYARNMTLWRIDGADQAEALYVDSLTGTSLGLMDLTLTSAGVLHGCGNFPVTGSTVTPATIRWDTAEDISNLKKTALTTVTSSSWLSQITVVE